MTSAQGSQPAQARKASSPSISMQELYGETNTRCDDVASQRTSLRVSRRFAQADTARPTLCQPRSGKLPLSRLATTARHRAIEPERLQSTPTTLSPCLTRRLAFQDQSANSAPEGHALYLNSDFVHYHQFLMSPEWGVSTSSSTLDALKQLPIPFSPDDEGGAPTLGRSSRRTGRCLAGSSRLATKTCHSSITVRGLRPVSLNLNGR